jgi:hypothetical protein
MGHRAVLRVHPVWNGGGGVAGRLIVRPEALQENDDGVVWFQGRAHRVCCVSRRRHSCYRSTDHLPTSQTSARLCWPQIRRQTTWQLQRTPNPKTPQTHCPSSNLTPRHSPHWQAFAAITDCIRSTPALSASPSVKPLKWRPKTQRRTTHSAVYVATFHDRPLV